MSDSNTSLKLNVGGTVPLRDAVYIVRASDAELLELLERGEYCNVLCGRQMGKTSLMVRTKARLAEKGFLTAEVDVAGRLDNVRNASEATTDKGRKQ